MTVKEIELRIIDHASNIAASDETLKNLHDTHREAKEANAELFGELKRSITEHKAEATGLNLRLSIAEKEFADQKVILERGRSFRWALAATLISVVLSSSFSAIIAYYVKGK